MRRMLLALVIVASLAIAGRADAQPEAGPPPLPAPPILPRGNELLGIWMEHPDQPPDVVPPLTCPRCWVQGSFLAWAVKDGPLHLPLLEIVTTPPLPVAVLGQGKIAFGTFLGGQVFAGGWIDPEWLALEAGVTWLEQRARYYNYATDAMGFPTLHRPVIDARTGQPVDVQVSVPFQLSGRLDVTGSSQLFGLETNARVLGWWSRNYRVDLLGGLRYQSLDEHLEVSQTSVGLMGTPYVTGAFGVIGGIPQFRVTDAFHCRNHFAGPQCGMRGEMTIGPCWVAVGGKIGVGLSEQVLRVEGSTTYSQAIPGTSLFTPGGQVRGGLYSGPSNLGRKSRAEVGYLSEGTLEAGIQVFSCLDLLVGYSFLYWDGVIRPGDQIDQRINVSGSPLSPAYAGGFSGPAFPVRPFRQTDFWAHGLTVTIRLVF